MSELYTVEEIRAGVEAWLEGLDMKPIDAADGVIAELICSTMHPVVVQRYQCRPSGMYEIEDDGGCKREPDDEEMWILAVDYDRNIKGVVRAVNPWEPGTTNARFFEGEHGTVTDSGSDDHETHGRNIYNRSTGRPRSKHYHHYHGPLRRSKNEY